MREEVQGADALFDGERRVGEEKAVGRLAHHAEVGVKEGLQEIRLRLLGTQPVVMQKRLGPAVKLSVKRARLALALCRYHLFNY